MVIEELVKINRELAEVQLSRNRIYHDIRLFYLWNGLDYETRDRLLTVKNSVPRMVVILKNDGVLGLDNLPERAAFAKWIQVFTPNMETLLFDLSEF